MPQLWIILDKGLILVLGDINKDAILENSMGEAAAECVAVHPTVFVT